ncbi:glycoside hydrolase [Catenovulum sp. 2E275]|uniref:sialidase family protein n=1 Tax=Catenovulum sp. 2E275 TaxID=2980497 RepID=UPI0021CF7770|nr:sialidase family protein [Catenovulum sp. 2E275]MCU4675988.1 glycoside hydrolase [Catenovulum sp. 2E275]
MYHKKALIGLLLSSVLTACSSSSGSKPADTSTPDTDDKLTVQQQCELDTFTNAEQAADIQIEWQQDTLQHVNSGVYSRVHKLSDGRLILVYSDGPAVVYRISEDNGDTWLAEQTVAGGGELYNYTNAEFIELADGSWVYGWNARPKNENGEETFQIKLAISYDKGETWQAEQLIFSAANKFDQGAWEPAFLQLPSGELQIYFANEFPFGGASHDQEISMKRSFDNGVTWGDTETLSYRQGSRDGMPVPILLNDQSEIVFVIEDNGIAGEFKPVTIRSSLADNWMSGVVDANSDKREHALSPEFQLDYGIYAGAPYIAQLPTGETILSTQTSQCRKGTLAFMRVYLGDDTARNFAYPTTPFTTDLIKENGESLWNGITVLDENTIMATSSVNTGDPATPNGIYVVKGKVIRNNG